MHTGERKKGKGEKNVRKDVMKGPVGDFLLTLSVL